MTDTLKNLPPNTRQLIEAARRDMWSLTLGDIDALLRMINVGDLVHVDEARKEAAE